MNVILKVVMCLVLVTPILGATGVFPPPTPDLYNTPEAFAFIEALMATGYLTYLITIVFAAAIAAIATKRTALGALLVLPVTVNIVSFHLFLDGGLLTGGAVLANVLLVLNLYFLWQSRRQYVALWEKEAVVR